MGYIYFYYVNILPRDTYKKSKLKGVGPSNMRAQWSVNPRDLHNFRRRFDIQYPFWGNLYI